MVQKTKKNGPTQFAELRQNFEKYVRDVMTSGRAIEVGTTRSMFILESATTASQRERKLAVPTSIDRARKNFNTVRTMARSEGIIFGMLLDGEVAALFRRDPDFRSKVEDDFRNAAVQRQKLAEVPTVEERLDGIISKIVALTEAVSATNVLLEKAFAEKRPRQYRKRGDSELTDSADVASGTSDTES